MTLLPHVSNDLWELHYIKLPRFGRDEPTTSFERWLHFLKFSDLYKSQQITLAANLQDEEGIEMALESMHKALSESDIRHLIEARRKGEHDEATRLFVAKQEGIEMGVLKGQVNLARAMLARGIPLEEVLSISGLSPDLLT